MSSTFNDSSFGLDKSLKSTFPRMNLAVFRIFLSASDVWARTAGPIGASRQKSIEAAQNRNTSAP